MGCVFDNPKCSTGEYISEEDNKDFSNFFKTVNDAQNDKGTKEFVRSNRIIIKPEEEQINSPVKLTKELSQRQSVISLQDELITTPKLKLLVYSNHTSVLVDTIILTPNSLKTQTSPIKIFKAPHKFSFGKDSKNDCVINDETLGKFQFHINFLFSKFFIIDNLNGTGLFVKVINQLVITHDIIVSLGADHMYIQCKQNEYGKDIMVKFCQNKSIQCHFSSANKKVITIGRNKKCDIHYQEDSISKVHCTLVYNNSDWMLYDGAFSHNEQRCSTNGLWLLANKPIELTDKMCLKTGGLKITVALDPFTAPNEEDNQINNQRSTNDEF